VLFAKRYLDRKVLKISLIRFLVIKLDGFTILGDLLNLYLAKLL